MEIVSLLFCYFAIISVKSRAVTYNFIFLPNINWTSPERWVVMAAEWMDSSPVTGTESESKQRQEH